MAGEFVTPPEGTPETSTSEGASVAVVSGLTGFPSAVAALAILASKPGGDRFADEADNEAQRQADGSVRLSIKQKDGSGHLRVWVRVPETVDLIVVDAPYGVYPE